MIKKFLPFLILSTAVYGSYPSVEENSKAKILAIRLTDKVVVDGKLTEKIWQRPGFNKLIQQDPDQGINPSQRTEFWVAYDDEAIYFAAEFYDNHPDSIMSRLVRRDFIWGDPSDGCVLYLDSYRDKRSGYFFYVSAAGTLADGLIENDVKQPNDLSWDAVWEGVSRIDSKGWSVEMKIPYSQLRFNKEEVQLWGINVERFISRRFETDMVVYTPRNESGFTSRFPDLTGIEGITPPARIELLPYVVGKAEYVGTDPKDPFNSGHEYSPGLGLDIRAGLGSSLTLNGTINPDFGQVELDPAVVNLTDVESIFEEKRPFFTEGVSIYKFGGGGTNLNASFNWPTTNIFYSRRIGRTPQGSLPDNDFADRPAGTHILGAAKISGEIYDTWKIGTIHAITKREFADISFNGNRSSVEIEPLTYYGILRAQRDFNSGEQGIGILSTFTNRAFNSDALRNSINKSAFVAAADGWTFLDKDNTYVLTGWGAFSNVSGSKERMIALQQSPTHYFQRPDVSYISVDSSATSLSGYSGRLMLNKNRGAWVFNTAVGFISPGFEINDLGFGSYSDYVNAHFYTAYHWNEPTDFYLNCGISAASFVSFDYGGNKILQGYQGAGSLTLHDYYGGDFSFVYSPSTLNSRRTRGGPLTLNPQSTSTKFDLYTDNRKWWVLTINGQTKYGEAENFKSLLATVEFKVLPTLTLSVGPEVDKDILSAQWLANFNDPEAAQTFNKRYIFSHLDQTTVSANIRADWIMSPTLSFQVYVQSFIASGKYSDFKFLTKPKTYSFIKFGESGSTLNAGKAENGDIVSYTLDPDAEGPAPFYTIGNPDFNYISLRGNAVLRWEYLPGSTLYLVWTQSRENIEPYGDFRFGSSINNLFAVKPDNIFMLKISYWL